MGQKSTRHATAILTRELNGPEPEPLYIALHETDPGADGDQTTGEVSYPGYSRAIVPRGRWSVENGQARNVEAINWPIAQGRGKAARYFSIGTAATGAGEMLRRGKLSSPKDGLEIVAGMMPQAKPGSLTLTES